jgi:hypothetical protein
LVQSSVLETQVTQQMAGVSKDRWGSAVLVIRSDLYVWHSYWPSVLWPVAEFKGLAWHLIVGINQDHGGQAIRKGDADEHMPVGGREKVAKVQDAPSPTRTSPPYVS